MTIETPASPQPKLLRAQIEQAMALAVELDLTLVAALLEHALNAMPSPMPDS